MTSSEEKAAAAVRGMADGGKQGGEKQGGEKQGGEKGGAHEEAPEGGWGWVVALGLACVLIVTLGPMACFGLIFGKFLEDLGEGTSGVTLVNSVYMCLHSFTGLLANYALKSYSCRQVALLGAVMFFVGNLLTVFATSVTYMIFSFAVLPGIGLGLMIPASFHCFNAYFVRRRVFVMGIAQTTLSGGIMLYPIIVEKLVVAYGFRGAQAIVAALTLHAALGALTFIPPRRGICGNLCLRKEDKTKSLQNGISASHELIRNGDSGKNFKIACEIKISSRESLHNINQDQKMRDIDSRRNSKELDAPESVLRIDSEPTAKISMNPGDEQEQPLMDKHHVTISRGSSRLSVLDKFEGGSPIVSRALKGKLDVRKASIISTGSLVAAGAGSMLMINTKVEQEKKIAKSRPWWSAIVDFFDLTLFKDAMYINLALGVAFAYYSDFTFVTLFPLFMFSLDYSMSDTAVCISIGAACDLGGRIAFSLLGVFCNIKSRTIFLIGSAIMVVGRTVMVYFNDYLTLNIANGIHGFFRAWIHANFSLVFAEYCPAERFPAAYGLFMAISGIIGISTGPLIGFIRDLTNSYSICIHSLNVQMLLCVVPWCLEYLYNFVILKRRINTTKEGKHTIQ